MAIFSLSRPPPGKFCKFWPKIDHFLTIFLRFSYLTAALEAFFGPPEIGPPGPGGQNDHFCHFQLEMTISRALWRPGLQKPSKTTPVAENWPNRSKKRVFSLKYEQKSGQKTAVWGPKWPRFHIGFSGKWSKMTKNGQKCNKKKGHFHIGFSGKWGVLF